MPLNPRAIVELWLFNSLKAAFPDFDGDTFCLTADSPAMHKNNRAWEEVLEFS